MLFPTADSTWVNDRLCMLGHMGLSRSLGDRADTRKKKKYTAYTCKHIFHHKLPTVSPRLWSSKASSRRFQANNVQNETLEQRKKKFQRDGIRIPGEKPQEPQAQSTHQHITKSRLRTALIISVWAYLYSTISVLFSKSSTVLIFPWKLHLQLWLYNLCVVHLQRWRHRMHALIRLMLYTMCLLKIPSW